jgi:hypothetical protein
MGYIYHYNYIGIVSIDFGYWSKLAYLALMLVFRKLQVIVSFITIVYINGLSSGDGAVGGGYSI